ncbi:MAG: UDP-N-acetylmuramoyl-tripeptide--D-alanyl-D-alanine ligase [Planctomycetota bacterium]|jgi:UDP-N-acetylmuramoyl-tripeptide--D-alanyl-D-alanine ligase|nr:UDP-N-acetylmuramoyl-tripeptide--D-alanyl-D-alanine ligase [Planctomycetota bacterium]
MKLTLEEIARWCRGSVQPPTAKNVTVTGISTDSRTIEAGQLFIAISGLNVDGHKFIRHAAAQGAPAALVRKAGFTPPGMPFIKVRDSLKGLGQIAHGYRWRPPLIPWVGVTGSNGKTTTREILSLILQTKWKVRTSKRNWNNFIGLPLSMLSEPDGAGVAVMELGTNHPGEIARLREILVPTIGIVTSTGSSHLEGFGSSQAVAKEKADIFGWLPQDGLAVYPADDRNADILASAVLHRAATFALSGKADAVAENIRLSEAGSTFSVNGLEVRLPLLGKHNVRNFLAAALAARHLGITLEEAATAALHVKPVAGRQQIQHVPGGLKIVNDTYNSNPDSLRAALEIFMDLPNGRKVAVVGDMLELGPESRKLHREAGLIAGMAGIDALLAFGTETVAMAESAQSNAHIMVRHFPSQNSLLMYLKDYLQPGDWVLVKGSRGMKMENIVNELHDWEPK